MGILHLSVDPLSTIHASGEMWASTGHPVNPEKLALAVGAEGNEFGDHGMRRDNSGRRGNPQAADAFATVWARSA